MIAKIKALAGLDVSVDEVLYMPDLEAPVDRPHPFIYFITIANRTDLTVTVRGRKWVVWQGLAETMVTEGDGVSGQFPHLAPGQEFSYKSKHCVSQSSEAEGAFFVETEDGRHFHTRIPRFSMQLPEWV